MLSTFTVNYTNINVQYVAGNLVSYSAPYSSVCVLELVLFHSPAVCLHNYCCRHYGCCCCDGVHTKCDLYVLSVSKLLLIAYCS